MVFFNYTTMQMAAKIVYYGPGLCGKTTNLQWIHQKTASQSRGEMISLETETDRTLFFDLLPIDVGVIGGMKVRLQLYTVPGQVFYNATRKLVLKGVDGIVFVADSQIAALEPNLESLRNLETNLAELDLTLDQVPFVLQYNKRDIRNINPIEKLNGVLNPKGHPFYEAAALHGVGVFETLKGISRLSIQAVRKKLGPETAKPASVAAPAAPLLPKAPAAAAGGDLLSHLVLGHSAEDVAVEFAEEDTGKHEVRAVETKARVDIQAELERLRTMAGATKPSVVPARTESKADRRLQELHQELLVSDRDAKQQELKRKSAVEVPAKLLKNASGLRVLLVFEGPEGEEVVDDAVTFKLPGSKKLERLTLHLDLELKGKG